MAPARHTFLAFWERDLWPGLLLALALWTFCFGLMMLGPGDVLDSAATFFYLRALDVPQRLIGAVAVADFAAIAVAISRPSGPRRLFLSAVVLGTIGLWCVIGAVMVLGAFAAERDGHVSLVGMYSAALALILAAVAMAQIGAGR